MGKLEWEAFGKENHKLVDLGAEKAPNRILIIKSKGRVLFWRPQNGSFPGWEPCPMPEGITDIDELKAWAVAIYRMS